MSEGGKRAAIFSRGACWREGAWVALVFAALWAVGFPLPHVDDIFYAAGGIELGRSGELACPPVREVMLALYGTERFYTLPPLHAYLLAPWTLLFGVSSASLRGFQVLGGLVVGLVLYGFVRRAGGGRLLGALAIAALLPILLGNGLRPEIAGMALLALGQVAMVHPTRAGVAAGVFLTGASALCHPYNAAIATPFCLWQGVRLARAWRRGTGPAPVEVAGSLLLGGLAVAALFFAIIRGEVREFLHVFRTHLGLISAYAGQPGMLLACLGCGWEPILKAPLAVLAVGTVLWALGGDPRRGAGLRIPVVVFGAFLGAGLALFPMRTAFYLQAAGVLLVTGVAARTFSGKVARALGITGWACVLVGSLPWWMGAACFVVARPPVPADLLGTEVLGARRICVDAVAARYAFDYRLPPHARDWTNNRLPGEETTISSKPAGEVWLLGEANAAGFVSDYRGTVRRLRLLGHTFGTFVLDAKAVVVLR